MLSQYLKYLFKEITFTKIVLVRFFIVLFKRNKNIELLKLNYGTNYLFKNSFIIIEYDFNNALWYSFNNKKTLEKSIKIFNLENISPNMDIIVHGFFRKKKYSLTFEPSLKIENQSFKTNFSNLSLNLKHNQIPQLTHPSIEISISKPEIKTSKVSIKNQAVNFNHNTYNQNEFI
ncbi:hypothetical protein SAMN05444146_2617 [Flavobacterium johnsoniae]|uniref:Uncharacterized protein n=1 Tax=Flavobacterium johnsoniae (strain ATCC 17061 / DSM 2064 / JCM 8514 / BCRC 14874 / CCUG 350202 / NBRC 14942 / NCIMB 11054 / UW101) TaxID=376686 RepID=A5FAC6_FLAJ1|nr:hypothetical protein Fjoh_4848 [Flavobacterium johnsoniae UW101]OXG01928.1 hypothetical protein B0A63_04520 [Flavobacterium johnsoniae UW101]SHK99991.1 hypothetical protein SAMN05444146_2617 [Flavobacterium johnsoniae]